MTDVCDGSRVCGECCAECIPVATAVRSVVWLPWPKNNPASGRTASGTVYIYQNVLRGGTPKTRSVELELRRRSGAACSAFSNLLTFAQDRVYMVLITRGAREYMCVDRQRTISHTHSHTNTCAQNYQGAYMYGINSLRLFCQVICIWFWREMRHVRKENAEYTAVVCVCCLYMCWRMHTRMNRSILTAVRSSLH